MKNMKKYILIYAVLMLFDSILSILKDLFLYFNEQNITSVNIQKVFYFLSFFPKMPLIDTYILSEFFGIFPYLETFELKIVFKIIVLLTFLYGIFKFKTLNSKKLLIIFLLITYFYYSFELLNEVLNFIPDFIKIKNLFISVDIEIVLLSFFGLVLDFSFLIINYFFIYSALTFLVKYSQIKFVDTFYSETSKKFRVYGRMIDFLLIAIFTSKFNVFIQYILHSLGDFNFSSFEKVVIFNLIATFFYYLILESCFSTTPGKIIMGYKIFNRDEEAPSFWAILGRTLCRYIPFEGLLFVLGVKLHDKLSGTFAYDVEEGEELSES